MVDSIVYAKVAVVDTVELFYVDGLVLDVVFRKVERELLLDFFGVDGGCHLGAPLVEHRQHGIIDIVVEKYDALLC